MIEMYLGKHSAGWAIDGRTQAWSTHDSAVSALESWTGEIERQRAGRWRKANVTLWLSGGLARPFLCGPVEGLAGWDEAEAMASATALQATGLGAACQVRLEGWPGDGAVLGIAVEGAVVQAVAEIARARRLAWRSVRPRWAGLLDEALARHSSVSLLACAEEDALTVLGGAAGAERVASHEFELAATYAPAPAIDRAMSLWKRTILSRDLRPDDTWFARLETPSHELDQSADDSGIRRGWPNAMRQHEDISP